MSDVTKLNSQSVRMKWVRLPGEAEAFVQKKWIEPLREAGLRDASDFFTVTGEPLSKPGLGKRYRARLSLPQENLYLKRYLGDSINGLLTRWHEDGRRTTTAEREATVATTLLAQGIGACEPVAYGKSGQWGVAQKSFLVTAAVPGISLENFFHNESQIGWKEKCEIVSAVAKLARRFHEQGWRHRDFYLCHIFILKTGDEILLTLIDLARVFRPRWRQDRWRIKDLAQLNYSAPKNIFSRTARLRFAKEYFQTEKLSDAQKNMLQKVLEKTKTIARHDRNRS